MNTAPAKLSRREQEVANLVAEGLTSKEIGSRLFITERTAEGHIDSIRNKLGVRSRAQIAAWVTAEAARPQAPAAVEAPPAVAAAPLRPQPAAVGRRTVGWIWLSGGAMAMIAIGIVIATVLLPALTTTPLRGPLISTYAGTGVGGGLSPDNDPARSTSISSPEGVAVGPNGLVYFTDGNRIRVVGTDGRVQTVAGTGDAGFAGDSGPALQANLAFSSPLGGEMVGIAVDVKGDVYFSDTFNDRVREITDGKIVTVAGAGHPGHSAVAPPPADIGDGGPGVDALLFQPRGLALDSLGNLYIADTVANRVRKLDVNGVITTVAGNGQFGFGGDGAPATQSELSGPEGLAIDAQNNLFVSDAGNDRIRKISNGVITTVVGDGATGDSGDGGPASKSALNMPLGIAFDARGTLYVADAAGGRIRKVDVLGAITTVAGIGVEGYAGDSQAAIASELNMPVALVASGPNLYIADSANNRIRLVQVG